MNISAITFNNIEFLWMLIIVVVLFIIIQNKTTNFSNLFTEQVLAKIQVKNHGISHTLRLKLLLLSTIFLIIAIARPQINDGKTTVKNSWTDVVFAIDMSKSMLATDIYPNRFEFARNKLTSNLSLFKNTRIALLGFSQQTFLISPLTEDFYSLNFLTQNLNLDNLTLKGTNILNTLIAVNELLEDTEKKSIILLTDGSDKANFNEEIKYAKDHNIVVYIYNIASKQGGIIKDKNGIVKDKNNNIVIVKANDNIKQLSVATGGKYLQYSLTNNDIQILVNDIKNTFSNSNTKKTIKNKQELFYYPLIIALIILIITLFSLPRRML